MSCTLPTACQAACGHLQRRYSCTRSILNSATWRSKPAAALRPWGHQPAVAAASSPSTSSSSSLDVPQLTVQLMQEVSRGNNPQPGDNFLQLDTRVEEACAQLAAVNPTPDAALSPLLNGSWVLLFSGRSRRLAAQGAWPASIAGPSLQQALQAASELLYSLFYNYVPVLAGSAVGSAKGQSVTNTQILKPGRVDNVVEAAGGLALRLCVSGSVEPNHAGQARCKGQGGTSCVAVRFDRFTTKLGPLPEAAVSLTWLQPLGYVDTLFLDQELRVSVGDKGGLFVLRRTQ